MNAAAAGHGSRGVLSPPRLVGILVGAAIVGPLAVAFVDLVAPSAEREGLNACNALMPTDDPKVFGSLPAPLRDFEAQSRDDKMVSLSSFRGRVVFLNFWGTWCPPCQKEMPSMDRLQRELGPEGLEVVAVASDKDWKVVDDFFPQGTAMTLLLDPPDDDGAIGVIAKGYGVPALPETFIIDRQGNVRYYVVNKRDWSSEVAVTCLRSLLDE